MNVLTVNVIQRECIYMIDPRRDVAPVRCQTLASVGHLGQIQPLCDFGNMYIWNWKKHSSLKGMGQPIFRDLKSKNMKQCLATSMYWFQWLI